MDFHQMKRKQLQALCKKHKIPANLKNVEMANRLASLLKVDDEKAKKQTMKPCLKNLEELGVSEEEISEGKEYKKVRFSPQNETFVFEKTNPRAVRATRRNSMAANEQTKTLGDKRKRCARKRKLSSMEHVEDLETDQLGKSVDSVDSSEVGDPVSEDVDIWNTLCNDSSAVEDNKGKSQPPVPTKSPSHLLDKCHSTKDVEGSFEEGTLIKELETVITSPMVVEWEHNKGEGSLLKSAVVEDRCATAILRNKQDEMTWTNNSLESASSEKCIVSDFCNLEGQVSRDDMANVESSPNIIEFQSSLQKPGDTTDDKCIDHTHNSGENEGFDQNAEGVSPTTSINVGTKYSETIADNHLSDRFEYSAESDSNHKHRLENILYSGTITEEENDIAAENDSVVSSRVPVGRTMTEVSNAEMGDSNKGYETDRTGYSADPDMNDNIDKRGAEVVMNFETISEKGSDIAAEDDRAMSSKVPEGRTMKDVSDAARGDNHYAYNSDGSEYTAESETSHKQGLADVLNSENIDENGNGIADDNENIFKSRVPEMGDSREAYNSDRTEYSAKPEVNHDQGLEGVLNSENMDKERNVIADEKDSAIRSKVPQRRSVIDVFDAEKPDINNNQGLEGVLNSENMDEERNVIAAENDSAIRSEVPERRTMIGVSDAELGDNHEDFKSDRAEYSAEPDVNQKQGEDVSDVNSDLNHELGEDGSKIQTFHEQTAVRSGAEERNLLDVSDAQLKYSDDTCISHSSERFENSAECEVNRIALEGRDMVDDALDVQMSVNHEDNILADQNLEKAGNIEGCIQEAAFTADFERVQLTLDEESYGIDTLFELGDVEDARSLIKVSEDGFDKKTSPQIANIVLPLSSGLETSPCRDMSVTRSSTEGRKTKFNVCFRSAPPLKSTCSDKLGISVPASKLGLRGTYQQKHKTAIRSSMNSVVEEGTIQDLCNLESQVDIASVKSCPNLEDFHVHKPADVSSVSPMVSNLIAEFEGTGHLSSNDSIVERIGRSGGIDKCISAISHKFEDEEEMHCVAASIVQDDVNMTNVNGNLEEAGVPDQNMEPQFQEDNGKNVGYDQDAELVSPTTTIIEKVERSEAINISVESKNPAKREVDHMHELEKRINSQISTKERNDFATSRHSVEFKNASEGGGITDASGDQLDDNHEQKGSKKEAAFTADFERVQLTLDEESYGIDSLFELGDVEYARSLIKVSEDGFDKKTSPQIANIVLPLSSGLETSPCRDMSVTRSSTEGRKTKFNVCFRSAPPLKSTCSDKLGISVPVGELGLRGTYQQKHKTAIRSSMNSVMEEGTIQDLCNLESQVDIASVKSCPNLEEFHVHKPADVSSVSPMVSNLIAEFEGTGHLSSNDSIVDRIGRSGGIDKCISAISHKFKDEEEMHCVAASIVQDDVNMTNVNGNLEEAGVPDQNMEAQFQEDNGKNVGYDQDAELVSPTTTIIEKVERSEAIDNNISVESKNPAKREVDQMHELEKRIDSQISTKERNDFATSRHSVEFKNASEEGGITDASGDQLDDNHEQKVGDVVEYIQEDEEVSTGMIHERSEVSESNSPGDTSKCERSHEQGLKAPNDIQLTFNEESYDVASLFQSEYAEDENGLIEELHGGNLFDVADVELDNCHENEALAGENMDVHKEKGALETCSETYKISEILGHVSQSIDWEEFGSSFQKNPAIVLEGSEEKLTVQSSVGGEKNNDENGTCIESRETVKMIGVSPGHAKPEGDLIGLGIWEEDKISPLSDEVAANAKDAEVDKLEDEFSPLNDEAGNKKLEKKRSILIHGTPRRPANTADMKENSTVHLKRELDMGDATALRPLAKRKALGELHGKN